MRVLSTSAGLHEVQTTTVVNSAFEPTWGALIDVVADHQCVRAYACLVSARVMLGMMVVGSALVVYLGSRGSDDPEPAPPPPKQPETPWLTPAAAAQVVGADGMPGPLFRGIDLGGPAPLPDAQARIAAFARDNNVDLRLEIAGTTEVDGLRAGDHPLEHRIARRTDLGAGR
jgi:hypothetical protein